MQNLKSLLRGALVTSAAFGLISVGALALQPRMPKVKKSTTASANPKQ